MGGTFVVTLREGFEAALILGIVYTYLSKIGAEHHYRYVTLGGALGVLASIALGVAVTVLSGPLLDLGPDLIGTAVIFVAVVVLTWHGYWMQQHARAIKGQVQRRIDEAEATHRLWIVGLIAFTGVFREGRDGPLPVGAHDPGCLIVGMGQCRRRRPRSRVGDHARLGDLPRRQAHQPAAVLRHHLRPPPVLGRRDAQRWNR